MRLYYQPLRCVVGGRCMTTATFVGTLEKIQQQLKAATDRRPELLRHGRHMFETETLEDLGVAYTPAAAANICHAASQLRISPVKGQPYGAVVGSSTSDAAIATMDADSLARIVHSCLVLRSPQLYEVLFTYARPLINLAPSISAVPVAVLLNAYGRAQFHHQELFRALCDSAVVSLKDPRLPLAQIANVAHALSRVRFVHKPLMLVLRDQATRASRDTPALVLITILDAFAELGFVEPELFELYEERLLAGAKDLPTPLMASLLSCLALAGRATPALLEPFGTCIISVAHTLDAPSIAKICQAYFTANVLSEEVLGAVAERACNVAADLRADEVRQVLNALSSFDLFDAELFPLLASRIVSMIKSDEFVGPEDAASILASFAAVLERHEELTYQCCQVLAAYPGSALGPVAYIHALWACATLSIRNESQIQMVENARQNPGLLDLPTHVGNAREAQILAERRRVLLEAYSINAAAA